MVKSTSFSVLDNFGDCNISNPSAAVYVTFANLLEPVCVLCDVHFMLLRMLIFPNKHYMSSMCNLIFYKHMLFAKQ
jgi:hypothetical protein